MRLFDAGPAVGAAAILALAATPPAGAAPVLSTTAVLKSAADNPVTQVQWIGWRDGWRGRGYRWHKRPAFYQGYTLCYGPPYGYSNWGYYNYGPCVARRTNVPWWYEITR